MTTRRSLAIGLFLTLCLSLQPGGADAEEGWVSLFDGETLEGWKVAEHPDSARVVDGSIVCHGDRAHVFYVGPVQDHDFADFELKLEVKTWPGSNSGVYFHTEYQDEGWPAKGYEAQVNNTQSDWRRTGSLYAIDDVREAPAKDGEWWEYHVKVEGKRIVLTANGETTVDYTEPENAERGEGMEGRRLSSGTFALQCHDPDSRVAYRNIRVKVVE